MLRIDVNKCTPGMTLALPVTNPRVQGQVLLKANFVLDQPTIDRLPQLGINWLWLQYPSLAFLEKFVNQQVLQAQGQVINHITQTFEAIQKQSTAKLPYEQYTQSIGQLVESLLSNPQAAIFMGDLTSSDHPDKALMRHSTAVTYLSLLMGLKLEGYLVRQRRHVDPAQAKEVVQLGTGAMLHDIGITLLDPTVRQKYAQSAIEDAEWKKHVDLGYQLVRGKISPTAATIVLNHHQRYDGSGYGAPGTPPLSGERFHVFARIVSLADYFDEQRNPVKGSPLPTIAVLHHLLEPETQARFDPQALRALITVAPPYPPGSILRLSDGQWATAIDHNPASPCQPKIQIIPDPATTAPQDAAAFTGQTIDLANQLLDDTHDTQLHVVQCDDQDTTAWNFPPPAIMAESLASSFL